VINPEKKALMCAKQHNLNKGNFKTKAFTGLRKAVMCCSKFTSLQKHMQIQYQDWTCILLTTSRKKLNSISILPGIYHMQITETKGNKKIFKKARNKSHISYRRNRILRDFS
jgi:tetrahydromethanopterin S-methyltransferase subunit E